MATEKRASSRSRLTNIGRVGAHACGDVELLAIATGVRLSQAAPTVLGPWFVAIVGQEVAGVELRGCAEPLRVTGRTG